MREPREKLPFILKAFDALLVGNVSIFVSASHSYAFQKALVPNYIAAITQLQSTLEGICLMAALSDNKTAIADALFTPELKVSVSQFS